MLLEALLGKGYVPYTLELNSAPALNLITFLAAMVMVLPV